MELADEGKTLLIIIIEHCFAKTELKRSTLLLKSAKKLFSCIIGQMQETSLSFNIVSSKDQFYFGVVALEHLFLKKFFAVAAFEAL